MESPSFENNSNDLSKMSSLFSVPMNDLFIQLVKVRWFPFKREVLFGLANGILILSLHISIHKANLPEIDCIFRILAELLGKLHL